MTCIRAMLALAIIGLFVGVGLQVNSRYRKTVKPIPTATPAPVVMVLENGVVYFEVTGDDYLKALQSFYKENPTLHCDYQGAMETLSRVEGFQFPQVMTTGHILHCHDIAIPAQEVTVP